MTSEQRQPEQHCGHRKVCMYVRDHRLYKGKICCPVDDPDPDKKWFSCEDDTRRTPAPQQPDCERCRKVHLLEQNVESLMKMLKERQAQPPTPAADALEVLKELESRHRGREREFLESRDRYNHCNICMCCAATMHGFVADEISDLLRGDRSGQEGGR